MTVGPYTGFIHTQFLLTLRVFIVIKLVHKNPTVPSSWNLGFLRTTNVPLVRYHTTKLLWAVRLLTYVCEMPRSTFSVIPTAVTRVLTWLFSDSRGNDRNSISNNFNFLGWGETWVHLVSSSIWPIVPATDDDGGGGGVVCVCVCEREREAVSGMRFDWGNRSTRVTPAPVPLCLPQIPHDQTWDGTRAAAEMGSRQLTNWAVARLVHNLLLPHPFQFINVCHQFIWRCVICIVPSIAQ
jgi:hypothetical protein